MGMHGMQGSAPMHTLLQISISCHHENSAVLSAVHMATVFTLNQDTAHLRAHQLVVSRQL